MHRRLLTLLMSPAGGGFLPWANRALIWQFARRDVLGRYRGSILGLAWSFITPLAMLAVYTFVFREVFKAKWSDGAEGGLTFALQVYAGLIVFNLFSEILNRSPRLVVDQPNLVKKVVFPLQILPWAALLAGFFHVALNLLVLLAAATVSQGLPVSALAVPLIFLAMVPFLLGIAWFLSALGVYVRDIGQLTGLLTSLLMFLSPIFFPSKALPEAWQPLLQLNPLTLIIEQTRSVVLHAAWPDWGALAVYTLTGCAFAWLGAAWFQAIRKGFSDVL